MKPIGTLALSDSNYVTPDNPYGWSAPVLANGVVDTVTKAAKIAAAYPCESLIIWDGFGGSADHAKTGYISDVRDAAEGITLADINACSAAITAEGVRPGIIARPQFIRRGGNRIVIDGSNPVGTLLSQCNSARRSGFADFYIDSTCDECENTLGPERFAQVVNAFPGSNFLVEFWHRDYAAPNVLHWCKAKNFANDHRQGVVLEASDVDAPAKVKAWGKRLQITGSTVLLNCRPDDPTLPTRQAGIIAAWKASQAGR